MTNQEALKYFVIAVPENEDQAKAYFQARKALLASTKHEQLKTEIEQLKRERDAAVDELKKLNVPGSVKHGRWILSHDEFCECSICKYPVYAAWNQTNFCPNCGARMEVQDDD